MTILICKKFFDINVIFFFSGKNIFWGVFFMCLNLVKSQKVLRIFEKLFLHVMLKINCSISALKNFQFEKLENLDLYHLPAHSASWWVSGCSLSALGLAGIVAFSSSLFSVLSRLPSGIPLGRLKNSF